MPYKDLEKQRECKRKSARKRYYEKVVVEPIGPLIFDLLVGRAT